MREDYSELTFFHDGTPCGDALNRYNASRDYSQVSLRMLEVLDRPFVRMHRLGISRSLEGQPMPNWRVRNDVRVPALMSLFTYAETWNAFRVEFDTLSKQWHATGGIPVGEYRRLSVVIESLRFARLPVHCELKRSLKKTPLGGILPGDHRDIEELSKRWAKSLEDASEKLHAFAIIRSDEVDFGPTLA